MKRFTFTLLSVFFVITSLKAQWTHLNFLGGETKNIIRIDSTLYTLTNSSLYQSVNDGNTWEERNTKSLITALDTNIYRYLTGNSTLFAIQNTLYFYNAYRLVVSYDGGDSWTRIPIPYHSESIQYFNLNNSLHALVYSNKTFYKFQNNTWTQLATLAQYENFFQIDSSKIFLKITTSNSSDLFVSNNAIDFRKVQLNGVPIVDSLPVDTTWNYIHNITRLAGDSEFVFIVAHYSKIYYNEAKNIDSINSKWNLISDRINHNIKYISKINYIDKTLYVSLQTIDDKFYTYFTKDLGNSYELDSIEKRAPHLVYKDIYYKYSKNGIEISNNKGLSWRTNLNYFKDLQINFIKKSKNRVFAYDSDNDKVIYSDDKGITWNYPAGLDSQIYTFPEGLIITDSILLISCNGVYFKSYDNGGTWVKSPLQIQNSPVGRIYFVPNHGFIATTYKAFGKVYRVYSTSDFKNFSEITASFPVSLEYIGGITFDANFIYTWNSNSSDIYKSSDLINWSKKTMPNSLSIYGVYCFNNLLYISSIVGDYKSAYCLFKFDGNIFTKINYSGIRDTINPQPLVYEKGIFYTIDRLSTNIYYSKNLTNWYQMENQNFAKNVKIKSESFLAIDSTVIIGTWSNGMYRYDKLKASINQQKNNSSLTLYPNPAQNKILLKHSEKIISYRITDYTGKLLFADKFTESGINVNQLQSGVYIVQVLFEDNSKAFGKLIVEK